MRSTCARLALAILICSISNIDSSALQPPHPAQAGIVVADDFRYAEPFIRTLEAGGLVVKNIAASTMEGFFRGGEKAANITTDKGVVSVVILPGATDAEQLNITYSKWNGNGHHFYITGPTVRAPMDMYGSQFPYFTLHGNWFIVTNDAALDGTIKRILRQIPAR